MAHSKRFVLTLGLLTGIAALTVDLSLPAVPTMAEALATSLGKGQQIIGVFIAGMACGQIPAGLLSDRLGRLPALYIGMTIFALSAIAGSLANSIDVLLAARFVQGMGAASGIVVARAIVRDVADGKDAARLMSLLTMIFTAAPVIAPTLGAILVAAFGWRAPFYAIAVCSLFILAAIRSNLHETHVPSPEGHPLRQLQRSIAEFFSHRQSIFALLMIIAAPAGFMSVITIAAALTTETYGYSLEAFGLLFAMFGISILLGSSFNRVLVNRFEPLQLLGLCAALAAITALQLGYMAWADAAVFWWLWPNFCVFMFTAGILLPNATVLALDPLPRIAGVASSIIGTLNNVAGASGAIFGAMLYDGSVRNSVLIMATVATTIVVVYLARPLICPKPFVRHPDELARD
ncbi:MAG: multidrug effflux MFS transporter [Woeseiaceae bacterium]|nr:multidrug effflux MFS transporter [Woeseiaceae bacterium]